MSVVTRKKLLREINKQVTLSNLRTEIKNNIGYWEVLTSYEKNDLIKKTMRSVRNTGHDYKIGDTFLDCINILKVMYYQIKESKRKIGILLERLKYEEELNKIIIEDITPIISEYIV